MFKNNADADGDGCVELQLAACAMVPAVHHVDGREWALLVGEGGEVAVHVLFGGGVLRQAVLLGVEDFVAHCFEHELRPLEAGCALIAVYAADGA